MSKCKLCNEVLSETNWYPSDMKQKYLVCKICRYLKMKQWYKQNIEIRRKQWRHAAYNYRHSLKGQKFEKQYKKKLKEEVLSHYGNNELKCVLCGYSNIIALTIDHIKGNGNKNRTKLNKSEKNIYLWLKRNKYPKGYRTLCMNCNWLVYRNGKHIRKKRRNILLYYAPKGECKNCNISNLEVLTIDHIRGEGRKHHNEIKKHGDSFYIWLEKNKYPTTFQVLCFNCQFLKRFENREYN